jgi:glycosyltransferase involved in cell wall biosynthesis
LIQTSYFEGFPNAVLEALSFGVPCIIFEAPGGHKEMISEGMNGFMISNENKAEVVIEKTILHDWDRMEIQSDVLSRFGPKKIIGQYEKLFHQILQK